MEASEKVEQVKDEENKAIIEPAIEKKKCSFCLEDQIELDSFPCEHKICPLCLFRRVFILSIPELNGKSDTINIPCTKCQNNFMTKNLDELCELYSKKAEIYKKMIENEDKSSYESNKCEEHNLFRDLYCIKCFKKICKKCNSNHHGHNILKVEKLIASQKEENKNINLKFKTKEEFEINWKYMCEQIKSSGQEAFNETMRKIEELSRTIEVFKKEYEEKYTKEFTKIVKILKVLKLYYYDYYFEKEESLNEKDIDSLRYVNSIKNEFAKVTPVDDKGYCQKIDGIKNEIENLRKNEINFSTKFLYEPIQRIYNFDNEIRNAHEKFISSIMELSNGEIMTTSFDTCMKLWQAKDSQFYLRKSIQRKGQIYCALLLEDDKIMTSDSRNSTIYIYGRDPQKGFVIEQTLSLHEDPIISMAKYENGDVITSGKDNLIIIWKKDENGSFQEKETIREEYAVQKIICLKNGNFGYTGEDGILKIMSENEEKKYQKICELKEHKGKITCICELSNGILLTGGGKKDKRNDSKILVWQPQGMKEYSLIQTLSENKADIGDIIQLKDGRFISSSKDHQLLIWKEQAEKKNGNVQYEISEKLTEYQHGMYYIRELTDGRICTVTSKNSLILWRTWGTLPYC